MDAVANEIERRDELGSKGIGGGVSIPYGVRALPARQGMMFPSNGSGLFCDHGLPVTRKAARILPSAAVLDCVGLAQATGTRRRKRERGARAYLLKAAAAPATVSGERRPSCHCRATGGKAEAMRMSREPGDLPAPVAHHPRGARG